MATCYKLILSQCTSLSAGEASDREPRAIMKYSGDAESVEWFNMAWRKVSKLPWLTS